jgi:DNA-binding SARP family transcriptional activator
MLEASLLGHFSVRAGGEPIDLTSRPAQTLLAFLLLNSGMAHRRDRLAGVLWPDSAESSARKNLRNAVWQLRKAIGDGYLLADKETVAFNVDAPHNLDIAALAREPAEGDIDALLAAASAYKGELLPGFDEDWVRLARERTWMQFERRMRALLDRLAAAQRWTELRAWATHWIALGQAPEPAYRAWMLASAAQGDLAGMAMAYRRCVQALKEELDVPPSAETRALYERLSRGALPAGVTHSQAAPNPAAAPTVVAVFARRSAAPGTGPEPVAPICREPPSG